MELRQVAPRFRQALSQAWSDISTQSRESDSRLAALRVLVVAGCSLTAIPAAVLLVRELVLGHTIPAVLLALALALIAFNLLAARREPYSIWPSRLMIGFAIFLIAHGVWAGGDQLRLIWPLVIPPVVLFVYGRGEGLFWTVALFLPCAAYLGTGAVETGTALDFVLAYLFSTLCAFAFQGLLSASRKAVETREVALHGAAQKFQDFADIDSDWFFELDSEYRIQYATGELLRRMGAAEQSLIGRNILELTHMLSPADPGNRDRLVDALSNRRAIRGCRFALNSSGSPIYIDISVKPFRDVESETDGFRCVAADVTEAVRQEAELYEKQRALFRAQKMEAVGQLTSGLAHDLNNILTVIGGNLDLLRHRGRLDATQQGYADDAMQAATRASELMSALLAFARQQPLEPTACSLPELLAGLNPLLKRALGETCALTLRFPNDLWTVHADHAQLESSLLNLGLNARDAMPSGGRLTIECSNETVGPSDEQLETGDYVKIAVSDTGGGVAENIREMIFDPFFTTKDVNEGSGLGLSMVFGFARQSKGDIRIGQTGRGGTTFVMFLPRALQPAEPLEPAPPVIQTAGG